jgi:hypothetical protein
MSVGLLRVRSHFSQQTLEIDGFRIEVVTTGGESLFPVTSHCVRGERDHGYMSGRGSGFELARCLPTIDSGQTLVHEDEIGQRRRRHRDALLSVARDEQLEAQDGEPAFQDVDVILVVLDIQYLHCTELAT